jgi:hypothetical protein
VFERGLADVLTLQRRKAAEISDGDEESFFLDTVAEYQWARDAAGLAPATLDGLAKPVIEVCQHYGLAPWRLTPRQVDKYFAGAGKRAGSTVRRKMNQIDGYFASSSSGTRVRSPAVTGWLSSRLSTRSTGPVIVVTSGSGCHRPSVRPWSSSRAGASRWRRPASPQSPAATT